MAIEVSYPGVYVQEVPGSAPTVPGVSTASTAFIDFFSRGPMNTAVQLFSMGDFERMFGGLHARSEASYAIQQYFLNGGKQAWIIRATDGLAKKAFVDVEVKTPGLNTRFLWATEYSQLADEAQKAADKAQKAAAEALAKLQTDLTPQEMKQQQVKLQTQTGLAGDKTFAAAEATRSAAAEARASSDELAIRIAQAEAGSGPVASRTAAAARNSAKAAAQSANAATQAPAVIDAAKLAATTAEASLKIGAKARSAKESAEELLNVLEMDGAIKGSQIKAQGKNAEAEQAVDKGAADSAAVVAATEAEAAASHLETAVDSLHLAASNVRDFLQTEVTNLKSAGEDTSAADASLANAQGAVDAVEAMTAVADDGSPSPVDKVVKAASDASWDAQTTLTLDDAKEAAKAAEAAATEALTLTGDIKTQATTVLTELLGLAENACTAGAAVAGDDEAASPTPVGVIVKKARNAIEGGIDAARKATQAAAKTSDDARVAASCVGSAAVNIAAREVMASANKQTMEAGDAVRQAKAVLMQVNSFNMTANQSVKPATDAATEAKDAAREFNETSIKVAVDSAQAALNAANNATDTCKGIEKAAVGTAEISVTATQAADIAAQAAHVAVRANEEASRTPTLRIEAINEGIWGDNIQVEISTLGSRFALQIREFVTQRGVTRQVAGESYPTLNLESGEEIYAIDKVNEESKLVRLDYIGPKVSGAYPVDVEGSMLANGDDGGIADADQLVGASGAMRSLDKIEPYIFNLMCVPAVGNMPDAQAFYAISHIHAYCKEKRAFYIADIPPGVDTPEKMLAWTDTYGNADAYHMAVYYPRLVVPDPLSEYRPRNIGSSGTMAGIYARTDADRGVWKAPAGINAVIRGATLAVKPNDNENGLLNPRGVNVLRNFPIYGTVVWGARTLAGADALQSEYKYINVRRLTNYIEESLFQGLKWAVFEPNDDKLWSTIRLQIGTFLSGLFASGAFRGPDAASSYYLACDASTTSPVDVDMGIVNIRVGIAPSKPAEFIVLQVQQIAGQAA